MAYEEDYLVRQLKTIGEAAGRIIASTFSLEKGSINLGQVEDENGKLVSGNQLLEEYLEKRRIHEAFLLIESKKYSLSYLDMSTLTSFFIKYLKELPAEERVALNISPEKIDDYQERLEEL